MSMPPRKPMCLVIVGAGDAGRVPLESKVAAA
jgi:hypothetical protein